MEGRIDSSGEGNGQAQKVEFGSEFDGNHFVGAWERTRLTRSQKCNGKRQHRENQSGREQSEPTRHPLDLTADELRKLHEKDVLPAGVRNMAEGRQSLAVGRGFV